MDLKKLKEINKKALTLDKQLKELRDEYAQLIEQPFVENDIQKLNDILNIVNADCLGYYRFRIYNKIAELEEQKLNSGKEDE